MRKIFIIFGTRPEAIKLCPLVVHLKKIKKCSIRVCVTAQHRQMLDQVLGLFQIDPDLDLDIMTENQSLDQLTSRIIEKVSDILRNEKPDIVVVQGDTTTTFGASLAAFYEKIPVAHVEAGLRTGNKYSPFPEEINRCLTTRLADFHFAPTEWARANLEKEGVDPAKIQVTGNTVIDALLWVSGKLEAERVQFNELSELDFSRKIILITGHRRENFGKGLEAICKAIKNIAEKRTDVELVYPVHLNPNVKGPVFNLLHGIPNIKLISPLDYAPFVYLMNRCHIIISDSGGIQEEAPSLGKPILVTRDTTERPEAIEAGTAILVGTNSEKIVEETERLLNDQTAYSTIANKSNPYGDGRACQRIAKQLLAGL